MASAATARTAYLHNLTTGGYRTGTPAREIVTMAGRELWHFATSDRNLMAALARNFYLYGRANNWRWIQTSNGNGTLGAGDFGIPLLRGVITATNCGGFNGSVRRLAHEILGLNHVTSEGAGTGEAFISRPALDVIDSAWPGNVRTLHDDFPTLKAFFFTRHSWNRLEAAHFDASTGTIAFKGAMDLMWCKLVRPQGCKLDAWSADMLMPPQPYGSAPYLIVRTGVLKQYRHLFPMVAPAPASRRGDGVTQSFIDDLPDLSGGWGTLLLVSGQHLPQAFRAILKLS